MYLLIDNYTMSATLNVVLYTYYFTAEIAQLVERCLAKAKVAGSNPVFRSIFLVYMFYLCNGIYVCNVSFSGSI